MIGAAAANGARSPDFGPPSRLIGTILSSGTTLAMN